MRQLGVTTAYARTKVVAGTNFPLVIILVRVKGKRTSTPLQNARSMSSVRTKGLRAPQRLVLDSRVNLTVTVYRCLSIFGNFSHRLQTRVLVPTISKISEILPVGVSTSTAPSASTFFASTCSESSLRDYQHRISSDTLISPLVRHVR